MGMAYPIQLNPQPPHCVGQQVMICAEVPDTATVAGTGTSPGGGQDKAPAVQWSV